jgi:hypothetical protein
VGSWRKRAAAGGAVSLFLAVLSAVPVAATTSCEGHACDATSYDYGCPSADVDPSAACCKQGQMVLLSNNAWVWQSTAQNAPWLSFPASGTIEIHTSAWTDAVPDLASSTIVIAPNPGPQDPFPDADSPDAPASYAAVAGGSLGEYTIVRDGTLDVYNSTCQPEYALIQIVFILPDSGVLTHGPCWN